MDARLENEPHHAALAIAERRYPGQPVMTRPGGYDAVKAGSLRRLLTVAGVSEQIGGKLRLRASMGTDLYLTVAVFIDDQRFFDAAGGRGHRHLRRQSRAEAPVDAADETPIILPITIPSTRPLGLREHRHRLRQQRTTF